VWQEIFRVLVKRKSAAVLYPALLQTGFLSAGPDGIRQERSHLLIALDALRIMQVYVLAVRPVSPSHGLSTCATYQHSTPFRWLFYVMWALGSHNPFGTLDRVPKLPTPFVPSC
ncbi:hypothetical protein SAMN05421754_11132, partial [Nitrosomonas sp. Nm58]